MKKEWNSPKFQELGLEKTAAEGQKYCFFLLQVPGHSLTEHEYLSECPAGYTVGSQCTFFIQDPKCHCPICSYLG